MRVYLIRHATAVEPVEGFEGDRRLSDGGVGEAQRTGRALLGLGAKIAVVLCSPLLRACQTAQEIARGFDSGPPVEIRDGLASGADPDDYFEELQGWEGRGEVAVVGHMPDLGRVLAVLLSGRSDVSVVFRPSAVCALDIDVQQRRGAILYFHGPDELREFAG